MRTPGHDEELALGFCLSEGIQPVSAAVPADLAANTVEVEAPGFDPERLRRSFYVTSSCGVCGKGALEAVAVEAPRVESELRLPASLLVSLPDRLREGQGAFAATGGLHATGLFDRDGALLCVREDVGRHNALDKVLGWAFSEGQAAARRLRAVPERPHRVRARTEGGPGGLPDRGRGRRAVEPRRGARGRPRDHPLRLHARGADERLLRGVARRELTGALLVGGASSRFGSPKALAELDGESLAERGWRVLGELCEERIAVGKASDRLELPFPVVDDGSDVRAPIAGLVAALRAASADVCVVLPVDCPLVTAELLGDLADEWPRRCGPADRPASRRLSFQCACQARGRPRRGTTGAPGRDRLAGGDCRRVRSGAAGERQHAGRAAAASLSAAFRSSRQESHASTAEPTSHSGPLTPSVNCVKPSAT